MVADNQSTELALTNTDFSNDNQAQNKAGFLSSLGGSGDLLRQVTLIVALTICLGIAILIILWAKTPEMRPLGTYNTQELIQTLDHLDAQKVKYKLEGNVILVPEDSLQDVRLGLSRAGLNQEPSLGTEFLLQDSGFGVSQRLEMERLKHSREQQLARTIEELQSIARARVLLAIPKENVFARQQSLPSATVLVTARGGRVIRDSEVDAIVDLVASAVQSLEPSRVTVTDQNGRLLNSGSQSGSSARNRRELEMQRSREDEYRQKVDSILLPVLGMGNYTAQVDLMMDFTAVEQTQKRYNPDLPAIRSEMVIEENSVGGGSGGIPGALSNQPPMPSAIPEQATGGSSQAVIPGRNSRESTRNFELDTTISHTTQQSGVIRRLSVSVAVDYKQGVPQDDGTLGPATPMAQAELENIRRLLQGGVGFDVQRGDTIEVISVPFVREQVEALTDVPIYEQDWFLQVVKLVMGGLVIIVLLLFIVLPMLKKLMNPTETVDTYDEQAMTNGLDLGNDDDIAVAQFDEKSVGFAPDGTLMLPDLHGDEDLLRAVRALVANEPELSSLVVKNWLSEDE
ncbi:flagellar basal-body MS-ring/collar protein FliF [Alishewanella sp. SMS8]|uniref:flagellar basal-body MS-ring/collar protein FliF n=1 Tax=Alishewanella sp. SMS8 TaxID=2994676 RepID=UPI00274263E7|nr:flagellar basal-body MS-ring/collar protein FliF [Alishewanella sp. SMS8]MDP5034635.1 flagellar basal-body MS-ring/collar protein FliF [Alishewanella sp.]MDP5186464.1 flagellar basal-body MS-ring/collar protein FliF [Alishewanella sp.]MDP5207535.1 flagellar basal-body MS-ring/collar protein FliF [Alishewanella sp. SMS9]MDP5459948.1 flagellar basal-body MS-ring/collar protein FliF [Alishewanella sp. SMS8]